MSRKWTAELDSILLHGVFEECQISFGKALCEKIAERVRAAGIGVFTEGFTECTPKAVENRLYSWKKKNVTTTPNPFTATGTATATAPNTPTKPAARARKNPATPKTPRPRNGAGVKKAGSEDKEDGEVGGRKRGSEEEMGDGVEKKVKLEEVDGEEDVAFNGNAEVEVKEEV
ncbi:hypothetical protein SVAN01_05807 [Stagonosporopsis vannaccii]|nr:hypothetical protein SVAN01_05807 [Stagonosporopsis vannaccii]